MAKATFQSAGGTLYAYLAGEIDHDAAQQLRLAVDTELDNRMPEELILDFGSVSFMDSSGVGLILGRLRRMQATGGTLRICHPPEQIRRILQLAQIDCMEAKA